METKSRNFFHVTIRDFEKKLLIPQDFARQIADESEVAVLVGPSGSIWPVKFNRTTDGTYLEEGWEIFSGDHSLCGGECLLFGYVGNMKFTVMIYATSTMSREDCSMGNSSQEMACEKRHTVNDKEVPFSDVRAKTRRCKKTETPSSAFHINQGKKKGSKSIFPEDGEEILDDLMFFSNDREDQEIPSSTSPTAVPTEPDIDYAAPHGTFTPSIIPNGTSPAPSRKRNIDRKEKQKVGKLFSRDKGASCTGYDPMASQFWRCGDKKKGSITIHDTVDDPETAVGVLYGSVLPRDKHKIEGLANLEEVKNLSSMHLASFNSLFVGLWDRVASELGRVEEFAALVTAKESLEKQVAELTQELEKARKSVVEDQQHKLKVLKWELKFNDSEHGRKSLETIKNYLQSENQSLKGELERARSNLAALRKEIRESNQSMYQQAQELESPRMGNMEASDEPSQNDDETSFIFCR